jgi:hypothetical protein
MPVQLLTVVIEEDRSVEALADGQAPRSRLTYR